MKESRQVDYDDLYEFLSQLENDEFEGYPDITYEIELLILSANL